MFVYCSKMLILKLFFALITVDYVTPRPGYTSLSNAILSSMTNLWNEKHIDAIPGNSVPNTELWHYIETGNYSLTSDEPKDKLQIYQHMPQTINLNPYHAEPNKANENIYFKHKRKGKGYRLENNAKQPKPVNFVETTRNNAGPLHNAVYDSHPLSYERLLHYYDYLDEYEAYSREKSNCSKSIETLLTKFLETIKVIIDRPIEVNANVAGCDTPIVGAPRHMSHRDTVSTDMPEVYSTLQPTTESTATPSFPQSSMAPPSYVGNVPSHSRYAEKQEDIVNQLKERYDKLYRLVEKISRPKEVTKGNTEITPFTDSIDSVRSESNSENGTYLQTDISEEPKNDTDSISTENYVSERIETTSSNIVATETDAEEEVEAVYSIPDKNAEDTEEIDKILPSVIDEFLPDGTIKDKATKIPTTDHTPFSRRKRRSVDNRVFSKRSLTTTTTIRATIDDIPYDSFVQDTLGNNTALLDTLVLNPSPIVEHIHDHLLKHEKTSQGEWKPPRKKINCTHSTVTKEPPLNVEELVSNPPEFIETV